MKHESQVSKKQKLLAIVELGGYPNLIPLYRQLGYQVEVVNTQRKANSYLKKHTPEVVVAEYNHQTDFRDRSSNLETLCAVLQRYPKVKLLVFYPAEYRRALSDFRRQHSVWQAIEFPIDPEKVEAMLTELRHPVDD